MDSKHVAFWLTIPIVLVGVLFLARSNTLDIVTQKNYQELGYYQLAQPRPVTSFTLQNHLEEPVDVDSLKGRISAIFFGFTHCPDVCPTTLSILNMATEKLKNPPQVILVSVAPERDTPALLSQYVTGFNKSFIAYTGSVDQVRQFARQLDAKFEKSALLSEQPGGTMWSVDHTANIVIVNKQGEYQGMIRPPHNVASIETILELLERDS